MGVGATGTVRLNAGIFKDIVKLKALDRKGKTGWKWGQHKEWPTPNNKPGPGQQQSLPEALDPPVKVAL
ncbi:hypothetical protein S40285_09278 [Stachybotrys chlorohalonatus IBT 40285]|uniref:Uncharacterized protein n=1 Tax=Stachybotrys chlorohalonatus (strain IBT 40285) TaxID=1283841 RepID=A0A084QZH2_STAC4|nr:hypothetical protein S40285_09278 [Stachybotrys chlorohalonata IBT 40285]